MGKNIEIELKFPLLNYTKVENYLKSNGTFAYESLQHDVYFNPPHRNFVQNLDNVCEWLRLRISDDKAEINYKDWQPHNEKIKTHCVEFETKIESYDQIQKILNALNFVELIQVKKKRKVWNIADVEISIDIVENLGEFIEIEYKGENNDIEAVRKHLFTFIKKIGAVTEEIDLKGYPFLLLEKRNTEGNLTVNS